MALQLEMGCSRHQADDCLRMRLVQSSIWKPCGYALGIILHYSFVLLILSEKPLFFFFKLNMGTALSALLPSTPTSALPPKSLITSYHHTSDGAVPESLLSEKGREDSACIVNQVPLLLLHLIICTFESRVQPT